MVTVSDPPVVTLSTVEADAPQLPEASRALTLSVWLPADQPDTFMLAVRPSMASSEKAPSDAFIGVTVPGAALSHHSAAAMFELPVAVSFAVAVSVTPAAPAVGFGVADTALVTGPCVSAGGALAVSSAPLSGMVPGYGLT